MDISHRIIMLYLIYMYSITGTNRRISLQPIYDFIILDLSISLKCILECAFKTSALVQNT